MVISVRSNAVIRLISDAITSDNLANQIKKPTERTVFGEELAVYNAEFYNAAVAGLKPSKQFEIYTREYRGEEKLKHNNITYKIIRTDFGKTPEKTRLICERVISNG